MENSSSESESEVAVDETSAADVAGQPKREILCRDSIAWLNEMEEGFPPGYCGFTSLPDISELQQSMFAAGQIDEYKAWFEDAVSLFMSKLPERSFVIFLQSDIRVVVNNQVEQWVDKSHLCSSAADRCGFVMMWHKLVCLNDNLIKRSAARPTYSHLVCYAKRPTALSRSYISAMTDIHQSLEVPLTQSEAVTTNLKASPPRIKINSASPASSPTKPGKQYRKAKKAETTEDPALKVTYRTGLFAVPDIFYRGEMVWSKGIGLDCCYVGVAFLKEVVKATCVVDPFAGQGTVLAMANALGMDALGVEISSKRCRKAKTLNLKDKLHLVSASLRNISLELIHEREIERKEKARKHQEREPKVPGGEDSTAPASEISATIASENVVIPNSEVVTDSNVEVKSHVVESPCVAVAADGSESTVAVSDTILTVS